MYGYYSRLHGCYMTQNNRIWLLMSRRLSGEATPAEMEELHRLLKHSPDKDYLYGLLHSYFSNRPRDPLADADAGDADLDARFRRIIDPPPPHKMPNAYRRRPAYYLRTMGVAAAVAALLVIGWALFRAIPATPTIAKVQPRSEEVAARAGARTKLLLPDGTQVWLNSNSKLKYSNEFNFTDREVSLEGEAFFDVAPNAHLPFIVHAASLDIEVLGTTFVVKSYPQDATVEATLLKGAIQVSRKGSPNAARIILKPNEKLVLSKFSPESDNTHPVTSGSGSHPVVPGDISINPIRHDLPDSDKVETGWMYNRLVFNGDNMQELAAKLERWYDVHIVIRDESLNHYHFGGAFENESIEEALKELQYTADFTYKINGKEIDLYAKK